MIVYRELSSLESDLGVSARKLYALSNSNHYHTVNLPKKGGGVRTLCVPDEALKAVQRRIAQRLLVLMPISPYATAYRDCGSTRKNAAPHVGQPLVVKLDILHFFDSIRYSDVKDYAFPSEMYAEPLRILLAMLCYHADGLPQGAPTSPAISNIILSDFDEALGQWCRERGISYTRYCDDMTFSGDFDPQELVALVRWELHSRGFLLNGQKTRICRQGRQQCVTGIVVNDRLRIPLSYRHKLRQELYFCRKFGISGHLSRLRLDYSEEQYIRQLLGRVNYVLSVEPTDIEMQRAKNWLRRQLTDS